ncbi:MAG: GntR family transcriptional regulator [Clostridiales bacterium]|nr:GntR family transcriptional regulator [Clostridiales bacterium]
MNNAPKYISLAHQIKEDILSGKYIAGSYLPPEAKLEELYSASRTTVRRAVEILKKEHLVEAHQGRGTQVLYSENQPTDFRKVRDVRQVFSKFMIDGVCETSTPGSIVDQVMASPVIAHALHIPTGSPVYRLQHIESVNSIPFAYMTNYIIADLVPNLDEFSGSIINIYEFLNDRYGIRYLSSEETICAVTCGFLESKLLNVEAGSPLTMFQRVAQCESGVFEYAETIIRSDLFRIVLKMGQE